jgi:hypothetical protein
MRPFLVILALALLSGVAQSQSGVAPINDQLPNP